MFSSLSLKVTFRICMSILMKFSFNGSELSYCENLELWATPETSDDLHKSISGQDLKNVSIGSFDLI